MSEVYDRYVDTAGNYHYTDMETGHHVIPNTAVGNFPPPQTIKTNADRIRSMTDEELAKYFAWLVDDEFPPCCEWEMYGDTIQINAWLEWLEDEVKT